MAITETGITNTATGVNQPPNGPPNFTDPWWKSGLAGVVTIFSLVAFFVILVYLYRQVGGATSESWTRDTYLFTGLEAITFTAVGWLFGKEVHRQEAQQAHQDTKNARQQADIANKDAAKGRALNQAVQAAASIHAQTTASQEEPLNKSYGAPHSTTPQARPSSTDVDYLAEFGRRLYS